MQRNFARRYVLAALSLLTPTALGLPALNLTAAPALAQDDIPVIAAAANLHFAAAEIAEAFAAETGMTVRLTFGSTGNLSRQIREGAPFEMLLAADDAVPLALSADGFTLDEGRIYALGRIVLVAPHGSPLDPAEGLDGVRALLDAGGVTRFAIANPDHAPFGIAARQALMARGLWDALQPLLVQGENVSQAAQFAMSGNAEGGIIAYALALAPEIGARGTYSLIPDALHAPLRQRLVLLRNAGRVAQAFYTFMDRPDSRAILVRHGFGLPEG